jgi:uroporphyrinogen-III synthase
MGAIEPEVMRAMREAQVDVISFFSPSAIENMRAELGDELLARLAAKAVLAAVGPVTAGALRSAGFSVAIVAPLNTAESMAEAIENYFSPSAGSKARAV